MSGKKLLVIVSGFLAATAQAQMRITEYMYNSGASGGAGEFVEFTNVGNTPIDMTGWSYDDDSRLAGTVSLSAFGIVPAKKSVVLAELAEATFRSHWSVPLSISVIGGNTTNLGRADEINLFDSSNALADRLTYGDQVFTSPPSIRTQAKSGWVSLAGLGANDIYQWTLSANGDFQNSYTSTQADIGNPGTYAPEPASLVMLSAGLLAWARRRR